MAIKKQKELKTGIQTDYIRIAGFIKRDGLDNDAEVFLEYYLNMKARTDKKLPVERNSILIPQIDSIADAYKEIKKIDLFSGAEDC